MSNISKTSPSASTSVTPPPYSSLETSNNIAYYHQTPPSSPPPHYTIMNYSLMDFGDFSKSERKEFRGELKRERREL